MTLTDWFQGTVKPVRKGVYMRLSIGFVYTYNYWTGEYWCTGGDTPRQAMRKDERSHRSQWQELPWRGILK